MKPLPSTGPAGAQQPDGLHRMGTDVFVREVARGLRREEFALFYQPVVDLRTDTLEGFEALVRWCHPRFGLLGADAFVPRMERAGTVRELGAHLLDLACAQAAAWPSSGLTGPVVRVNVSARQLDDDRLRAQVPAALCRSGLPPDRLVLEVTETARLGDVGLARRVCGSLQDLGVRLSLDDYGADSSDPARLRQLPVDEIKIDRHLTAAAHLDPGCLARVRHVVEMAAGLGLRVTVEGVETAAQLALVRGLGDVAAQGYWFGRPAPLEGPEAYLVAERRAGLALVAAAARQMAVAG